MRAKLRYVLPVAQMALAAMLLWWSNAVLIAANRHHYVLGTTSQFSFLVSLNAPVAFLRAFWFRHLPFLWDDITFTAAIGLLWYWVALNLHSLRQKRKVCMFSWPPLRLIGDIGAIGVGVGVFWGFIYWRSRLGCIPVSWLGWLWCALLVSLPLAWSVFLIFLFGRDFIHCILRRDLLSWR